MTARLLVIEDGNEYGEFARLFLSDVFDVSVSRSVADALAELASAPADAMLIDLRFDRTPIDTLTGDIPDVAARLFGGDRARALRYVQDQQGALILAELRRAGHDAPAVFVHDFPPRRLENLRKLYGNVEAVPVFDAAAIRFALGVDA